MSKNPKTKTKNLEPKRKDLEELKIHGVGIQIESYATCKINSQKRQKGKSKTQVLKIQIMFKGFLQIQRAVIHTVVKGIPMLYYKETAWLSFRKYETLYQRNIQVQLELYRSNL
ncbi:hypothetical protein CIPAW_06G040200 [Carya illinoinensis]|uniref:Uncharacterized protein n=1 Tax=Carya illinoinensis TaxID=32201 RepID=A0A8T1Q7J6_CARIL|nr:hypothetical protein CIPAW_06G040200 [Carya illinoinensis]